MSQIVFKISDKLGKVVHKIIFVSPIIGTSKFIEICQRYYNPKDAQLQVGKRAFPVSPEDWVRQSGNRFIQYKDWQTCQNYVPYIQQQIVKQEKPDKEAGKIEFYVSKQYVTPKGKVLSTLELGANQLGKLAHGVLAGSDIPMNLIIVIVILAAGLMGGMLAGYFGLPPLTGQHLVPNPTVAP